LAVREETLYLPGTRGLIGGESEWAIDGKGFEGRLACCLCFGVGILNGIFIYGDYRCLWTVWLFLYQSLHSAISQSHLEVVCSDFIDLLI
jgi:hypothetical protein